MDNVTAAKMLVKMIADLSDCGFMKEEYAEAVALACTMLYQKSNNVRGD